MADTYMAGIPGYSHNNTLDDGSDSKQSDLFRTLLAHTMQQNAGQTGIGGILSNMLGTAASMYGQPGMLGGQGLTANTGMAGDSLGQVSLPASAWGA